MSNLLVIGLSHQTAPLELRELAAAKSIDQRQIYLELSTRFEARAWAREDPVGCAKRLYYSRRDQPLPHPYMHGRLAVVITHDFFFRA